MWREAILGVLGGLLLVYVVMLLMLWLYARKHPETITMKDALRLLPDLLRLVRRLAADKSLPAGVRARLFALLIYLILPIDLVPDFLPVIGYADDAIVVAWILRSVIRRAGVAPVRRHWPGTPEGLRVILTLAGIDGR
ncbi:YkvA family protein [Saxibacter everestensis]|uniref:YkvA family protein n=1 Tax=Saxibacter everestensis TaxID=2909229 RepID=A0ABY8QQP7_9MICO|nr:YkvA family protein [Brevibacteriaceae bacterium ZFBP1038]